MSKLRNQFETWISGPPFEADIYRYPDDPMKYAWPGSYKDIDVQLAWAAWLESARLSAAPPVYEDWERQDVSGIRRFKDVFPEGVPVPDDVRDWLFTQGILDSHD